MHKTCTCHERGFSQSMAYEEIVDWLATSNRMCSDPWYMCPTVLRALTASRFIVDRKKQYEKRTGNKSTGITRKRVSVPDSFVPRSLRV